jgi:uncharacterized membrane protein SpoIIM required for sporulation
MRQAEFERRHGDEWHWFDQWLSSQRAAAPRWRARTPPADDFPARYRALCQHLALARARAYSPALVERLQALAGEGHRVLYGARPPRSHGLWTFATVSFPRRLRSEWRVFVLACLLFFGPFLTLGLAVQWWPDMARVVIPAGDLAQVEAMYSPDSKALGRPPAEGQFQMFAFYIWNNVRIGFQTFAGGVLLGLGTIWFLLFNGVYLGTLIGHLVQVGLGVQIASFVAGHSALELIAIAVSGAAGLKLGGALLAPGGRTRKQALVEEGRKAFELIGGAALMFAAAAVVEGFFSPLPLEPALKYAVGALFALIVVSWLALSGRGGDAAR